MSDYAFIDEVWREPSPALRKKGQKKQAKTDPSCSLYKKRDGKLHDLDDIMDQYMGTYEGHERNEKRDYERHERDCLYKSGKGREEATKNVVIYPNRKKYDVSSEESAMIEKNNPPRSCYNYEEIEGVMDKSLLNAYDFDKYYEDYIKKEECDTSARMDDDDEGAITQEEGDNVRQEQLRYYESKPLTREEIYRDLILEKYANMSSQSRPTIPNEYSNPTNGYIELALYVISGIILIFMMEQILKLGVHLR